MLFKNAFKQAKKRLLSLLVYWLDDQFLLARKSTLLWFSKFHLMLASLVFLFANYYGKSVVDCFYYTFSATDCNDLAANSQTSVNRSFEYEYLHSPYQQNMTASKTQLYHDTVIEIVNSACYISQSNRSKSSGNKFTISSIADKLNLGFIIPYADVFTVTKRNVKPFLERAIVLSGHVSRSTSAETSNRLGQYYYTFDKIVKQNADAPREHFDYYPNMLKIIIALFVNVQLFAFCFLYFQRIKKFHFATKRPSCVLRSEHAVQEMIKVRCSQMKKVAPPAFFDLIFSNDMWQLFTSTFCDIFLLIGLYIAMLFLNGQFFGRFLLLCKNLINFAASGQAEAIQNPLDQIFPDLALCELDRNSTAGRYALSYIAMAAPDIMIPAVHRQCRLTVTAYCLMKLNFFYRLIFPVLWTAYTFLWVASCCRLIAKVLVIGVAPLQRAFFFHKLNLSDEKTGIVWTPGRLSITKHILLDSIIHYEKDHRVKVVLTSLLKNNEQIDSWLKTKVGNRFPIADKFLLAIIRNSSK